MDGSLSHESVDSALACPMCSLVNRSPVPEHYAITLMIKMRTVIILLYGDAKDVSRLNSRVLAVMGANHKEVENTFLGRKAGGNGAY